MALDAILFDLDGTVWDSAPGIVACLAHTLSELGLEVPPDEVLGADVGPPLQHALTNLGVPSDRLDAAVATYRARYLSTGAFESRLYPGFPGVFEALRAAGSAPLATATSKAVVPTRLMLDHYELTGYFSVVGAASMDGRSVHKASVIGEVLTRLGGPARVVLVGDRHYDVHGAAEHGVACIGVSWGYGSRPELESAGAETVVDSPDELVETLLGWR